MVSARGSGPIDDQVTLVSGADRAVRARLFYTLNVHLQILSVTCSGVATGGKRGNLPPNLRSDTP